MRVDANQIEFLDTIVKIENGKLSTSLYTKPTDKHMYLNQKSSHPTKTKESIPYSQAIRLKRICSNQEDYQHQKLKLRHYLRKRGYSGKVLDRQFTRADRIRREDLLKPNKKKEDNKRVPLVLTYSRKLPNIHTIVQRHLPLLHQSDKMKEVFTATPLIAYRRDKNISDVLVHGKTNRVVGIGAHQEARCTKQCVVCDMLGRGLHTNGGIDGVSLSKRQSCQTWNIIYGINCLKCQKVVYVGETKRALKQRLKEHEADVRLQRKNPVAEHFNSLGHGMDDIGVSILQCIRDDSGSYRKLKELSWIQKLQTEVPNGINYKSKLRHFVARV